MRTNYTIWSSSIDFVTNKFFIKWISRWIKLSHMMCDWIFVRFLRLGIGFGSFLKRFRWFYNWIQGSLWAVITIKVSPLSEDFAFKHNLKFFQFAACRFVRPTSILFQIRIVGMNNILVTNKFGLSRGSDLKVVGLYSIESKSCWSVMQLVKILMSGVVTVCRKMRWSALLPWLLNKMTALEDSYTVLIA